MMRTSERAPMRARGLWFAVAAAVLLIASPAPAAPGAPAASGPEDALPASVGTPAIRLAAKIPPPRPKPQAEPEKKVTGAALSAHLALGRPAVGEGVSWTVTAYGGGDPIHQTEAAAPTLELGPGRYRATAKLGPLSAESDFLVNVDKVTPVRLGFGVGRIEATVVGGTTTMPIEGAQLTIVPEGADEPVASSTSGEVSAYLAPGRYDVGAKVGLVSASRRIDLAAGMVARPEIVLAVGYVVVEARASEGSDPVSGATFALTAVGAAGEATDIAQSSGRHPVFSVAPGEYRLKARYGLATSEQVVRVAANRLTPVSLTLDAARLELVAIGPGAAAGEAHFRIFRDGASGSIEPIAELDGTTPSLRLAAGSYTVEAERAGEVGRESVTLVPGQRAKLRVSLGAGTLEIEARSAAGAVAPGKIALSAVSLVEGVEAGGPIALGTAANGTITLPAGRYRLTGALLPGGATASSEVAIERGTATRAELEFDFVMARLEMRDKPNGAPLADGSWVIRPAEGPQNLRVDGSAVDIPLAPGTYRVYALSGILRAEDKLTVTKDAAPSLTLVPK